MRVKQTGFGPGRPHEGKLKSSPPAQYLGAGFSVSPAAGNVVTNTYTRVLGAALVSGVKYRCNNPLSAMGETCSPEPGEGENDFQLVWFKLFVFVILKPVWKRAGRGLVQK